MTPVPLIGVGVILDPVIFCFATYHFDVATQNTSVSESNSMIVVLVVLVDVLVVVRLLAFNAGHLARCLFVCCFVACLLVCLGSVIFTLKTRGNARHFFTCCFCNKKNICFLVA